MCPTSRGCLLAKEMFQTTGVRVFVAMSGGGSRGMGMGGGVRIHNGHLKFIFYISSHL